MHTTTKTYPGGNHTSTYNATLVSPGTSAPPSTPSIYNLIKKTPVASTPRFLFYKVTFLNVEETC